MKQKEDAMQTLTVSLPGRSYPVTIGRGILSQAGEMIHRHLGEVTVCVITDDHVAPLYLGKVIASLKEAGLKTASISLPHGEQTKSLDSLKFLYDFLCARHITRKDVILALGGGVIGDLAGLAAATWLRGIPLVQVPTSLLAQVDSSVGGKVAVDLPQGKNLVGAFHQPSLVLCDPDTLETLPEEFWRDGMGEVVKYGCIADEALFALLEGAATGGREALSRHMDEILLRCIAHKADVVARDELDTGWRMTLNFGHTLGHAIEACQHYDGLRHGEAVSIGMAAVTRLTEAQGMTAPGTALRLETLLRALHLPTAIPDIPFGDLLCAMSRDKKSAGNDLRLIALDRIGACRIITATPDFYRPLFQSEEASGQAE